MPERREWQEGAGLQTGPWPRLFQRIVPTTSSTREQQQRPQPLTVRGFHRDFELCLLEISFDIPSLPSAGLRTGSWPSLRSAPKTREAYAEKPSLRITSTLASTTLVPCVCFECSRGSGCTYERPLNCKWIILCARSVVYTPCNTQLCNDRLQQPTPTSLVVGVTVAQSSKNGES